jgi:hypothetical protein
MKDRMLTQVDKQILKSWRQYAIEPRIAKFTGRVMRNTGPRIAIIGNCQSFGVAYAMKVLDPSATVDHYSMIARARSTMGLFVKTLETYDYVLSHDFLTAMRGGGSEELCKRLPKTMIFPAITFAAFHPDLVYIHDLSRMHGFVCGPIGPTIRRSRFSPIARACRSRWRMRSSTRTSLTRSAISTCGTTRRANCSMRRATDMASIFRPS